MMVQKLKITRLKNSSNFTPEDVSIWPKNVGFKRWSQISFGALKACHRTKKSKKIGYQGLTKNNNFFLKRKASAMTL